MQKHDIALRRIDPDALQTVKTLTHRGYEAYLVGGCVRDLLLGYPPKDFDVATSATPQQVRSLFRRCHLVGRRFRLAHVVYADKIIQVATFRKSPRMEEEQGESKDLLILHDNVYGTAREDAYRRDFPINALFFNVDTGQVIDYVSGKEDLQRKILRTIGPPDVRFREDPIRMLRAVRFAARLGFEIESDTYEAILHHQNDISRSAPARLLEEIYRIFRSGSSFEAMILMQETGILHTLFPHLAKHLHKQSTLLDPYLQAIDHQIQQGKEVDNTTLLCLLAIPELEPLFDRAQAKHMRNGEALVKRGVQYLAENFPLYQREILLLRSSLLGYTPRTRGQNRKTKPGSISLLFETFQQKKQDDSIR